MIPANRLNSALLAAETRNKERLPHRQSQAVIPSEAGKLLDAMILTSAE